MASRPRQAAAPHQAKDTTARRRGAAGGRHTRLNARHGESARRAPKDPRNEREFRRQAARMKAEGGTCWVCVCRT